MECDGLAMCSTVAFRRLPVMANCIGGCVCVCVGEYVCVRVYIFIYILYIRLEAEGGKGRGMRSEEKGLTKRRATVGTPSCPGWHRSH